MTGINLKCQTERKHTVWFYLKNWPRRGKFKQKVDLRLPALSGGGTGKVSAWCRVSAWGDEHSPEIDSGVIAKHCKAIKSGKLHVMYVSPQLRTNEWKQPFWTLVTLSLWHTLRGWGHRSCVRRETTGPVIWTGHGRGGIWPETWNVREGQPRREYPRGGSHRQKGQSWEGRWCPQAPASKGTLSSRGHLDGQPLESSKQGCPGDQIAERPEQELGDS